MLEDQGDLTPAQASHFALALLGQVHAVETDLAADHTGSRRQQADDGETGSGLAASRFTHETQRFALPQRKTHALDRLDDAAAAEGEVMGLQLANLQQWRVHASPRSRGCAAADRGGCATNRRKVAWPARPARCRRPERP